MNDRERAIVMAYTGYAMLTENKLGIFYEYVEEKLGRPIVTHELAFKEVVEEIQEKAVEWFEKKIAYIKQRPEDDYGISDCHGLRTSDVWKWLLEDWRKENGNN